jgi:hypothetical protein
MGEGMTDFFTPELVKFILEQEPIGMLFCNHDDTTYCHGIDCPQNETCKWWIGNYKGHDQYLSQVETFRKGGECENYSRMATE